MPKTTACWRRTFSRLQMEPRRARVLCPGHLGCARAYRRWEYRTLHTSISHVHFHGARKFRYEPSIYLQELLQRMWLWRQNRDTLPQADVEKLKKKAASLRRAYSSCLKSNDGIVEPCRGLEIRLVEEYAAQCCQQEAAAFRECYTAIFEKDQSPAECDPYIKAMRSCLKRKGLLDAKARPVL